MYSIKRRLNDALCWNGRAIAVCGEPDGPAHYVKALQDDTALLEELLGISG